MSAEQSVRDERLRIRWAAIGAAVAVSLGGGGLFVADAASSSPSAFVSIDPVRVLDSRDPLNVGLVGPFVSAVGLDLQVTGSIPTTTGAQVVVPDGATGVSLNVTVVHPVANGFVSVRPANAVGAPSTSSLNFLAGDIVPSAVTVQLPASGTDQGTIEITYDAYGVAGATTDILVDVVGYYQEAPHGAGPQGPAGQQGEAGPQGPAGSQGPAGPQGPAGSQGTAGAQGPAGSQGPAGGLSNVINRDVFLDLSTGTTADVFCEPGETAIGGSVNIVPDGTGVVATSRAVVNLAGDGADNGLPFIGWRGVSNSGSGTMLVHVYCAS